MSIEVADGIVNCVEPAQTAPLRAVKIKGQ